MPRGRRRSSDTALCISPGALWLFPLAGVQDLECVADPDGDSESRVLRLLDLRLVRDFVALLPDRERSVVALRYGLTGPAMSCRGTGEFLGLPASTVHETEKRALARLRSFYEDAGLTPS